MDILITGGTGFIGQPLCKALEAKNHTLWVLTQDPKKARQNSPQKGLHFFKDLKESEGQNFDTVINLPGEPIAKRWTKSYKLRPTFFHVPAFILKWFGGEMAKELLLSGEKILPTILIERGFNFLYPELERALSP